MTKLDSDQNKTAKNATKDVKPTKADLLNQAEVLKQEAYELKRNLLNGDVQNVHAYKYKRRELAKLLTAINCFKAQEEKK